MLKKLPNEAYGLSLSLVEISDAHDIVALRSNPELTKYMVTLGQDVAKQKEWIREYKKREQRGEDYYFSYRRNNDLVGFARISHVDFLSKKCCLSSWIKNPHIRGGGAQMLLSRLDIAFEYLKLNNVYASIHQTNSNAMKYWQCFNCNIERKSSGYNELTITAKEYCDKKVDYYNAFIDR